MTTAEVLFAEHRHRLFLYFCRAVGHPETAHDLTQDVFLRVTRAGPPAVDGGDLRPWLFRIARNLAFDHHRRLGRHPDERAGHVLPAEAAAGVAGNARQETTVAINEALAALDELDRHVFLMREIAGLRYDEIAQACDLTVDAVRPRIHRTRLRLRDHLRASIHDVRERRTSPPIHGSCTVNTAPHASDVISAFLDNEPFDAAELSAVLADPAGRAALIYLIALRGIVQSDVGTIPAVHVRPRRSWRLLAASIALPIALVASYGLGWRAAATNAETAGVDDPPAPTRVITNLEWTTGKGGN